MKKKPKKKPRKKERLDVGQINVQIVDDRSSSGVVVWSVCFYGLQTHDLVFRQGGAAKTIVGATKLASAKILSFMGKEGGAFEKRAEPAAGQAPPQPATE